ncbi:zinc finger, CCHC-type containing protein [Tanacetum coccineum]
MTNTSNADPSQKRHLKLITRYPFSVFQGQMVRRYSCNPGIGSNNLLWKVITRLQVTAAMSVVYVLTTHIPKDGGDDTTVEQVRKRNKWDNDDYVCRCLILKVMGQHNKLLGILGRFTQHKIKMDEAIKFSCIIDKLLPSWKVFKHTLKHKKEELNLVELGSHLRIEESLRAQDSDKPKGNNVVGPQFCYVYLLHSKDEALDKFKVFKTEVELQQGSQIKRFRTDRGGEYMDTLYFQSVGIIHETTAPYTPQQNGISERKNRVLKEMVNSMLSYSGLSQGFWGEAMLTACYLLNRVPNKRNRITPYELWTKRKPNLNYLRVWGCRAVVRLPDPKLKTLGERGIECIFVGYAEHSKAFRFYVIEPNDSVAINLIIESTDVIFDNNRFSSIPRPSITPRVAFDHLRDALSVIFGLSVTQEWPTCSWKEDGYCNGGNLPGAYIVRNTLRYQDLKWYGALKDSELKDEDLRNKAIMEGLIDDESSNNDREIYELFDDYKLPVCNIRRFEMIKYSFRDDEEYVVVEEDEYDDLMNTSKDVCRAYQEIFRMMDEGWMVTRNE